MLSHVPGLQTYNSKQPFSLVNGVAVQIYRQASKLTTSPGSLRLHIEITCDYITLQIYMRPAKRWGWKSQGSPFERFAWPCVFSSPVFNSLPAEIGNIRYTIFRDNAGLLRNLEDAVEFFAQRRHILPDFVIGNLGVDLGRGDMFMSQHLADRFQRYALRKRDRCGKGMPRHVDRRIERQSGMFSVL